MTATNNQTKAAEGGSSPAACCVSFVRMFKPQFAGMVDTGNKRQTVRPIPKRMPKPGDRISLRCWTDKPYRSKQRVLRDSVVSEVQLIRIEDHAITIDGRSLSEREIRDFARADGFNTDRGMIEWFATTHGLPFDGVVIHWHNDKEHAPALAILHAETGGVA